MSVPFVSIKISQQMESATLLTEALQFAIFQQRHPLQVILAYPVPLVILLFLVQILAASLDLVDTGVQLVAWKCLPEVVQRGLFRISPDRSWGLCSSSLLFD